MFPILQIGPLAIQLSGLLLLAGVWIATTLIERTAPRFKISPATVSSMIFYALIAGLLGARIGYVLQFLDAYAADPISILALNPNTLSLPEGVLTGILTAWVYGQRKGLPLWPTLDALTPGLAVFMVALGLAHLSSGDAFGAPTGVAWAVDLWGAERHPSQVYEILGATLILILVLRMQDKRFLPGMHALSFAALSAALRLFLEAFRGDSTLLIAGIRQAQVISLIVLLGVLLTMRWRVIASERAA